MNRRAFFAVVLAPFMPKPKAPQPAFRFPNGSAIFYGGGMGGGKSVAMMHHIMAAIHRGESVYIPGRRSIK